MKDEFFDISISEIFKEIKKNHKKKRKTKEERELEKDKRLIERENYNSLLKDRFSTLNGLRNEIYTLIYNYDIMNFESNLKTLDEIYENKDIDTLEKIIKDSKELIKLYENSLKNLAEFYENEDPETIRKMTYKAFESIKLYQGKQAIIKFLKVNEIDIKDILNEIKTYEECDIVYEALVGTEHITLLPKGYAKAKKAKLKSKNKKKSVPRTYEHALRRNRHMLESYLKEIAVGQQKAQKISQILQYL